MFQNFVGSSPTESNREIIRKLLVSSLQAQWDVNSCLNPSKTMQSGHVRRCLRDTGAAASNDSGGMYSFRSECLYVRMGRVSPE